MMPMEAMEIEGNRTLVTHFVLLGFTTDPLLRKVFFVLFLASYTMTLIGNAGLMTLIYLESCLHTPMYFFISSLSFLDIWYSSVYTPRILSDCISDNHIMSIAGCAAQVFFSCVFVYSECFLLSAMAYDRYVAICNPLLYVVAMPRKLCIQLVVGSYIAGLVCACIQTGNTFRVRFCGDNTINHFFCDGPPTAQKSCDGDTLLYELILNAVNDAAVVATTVVILRSYTGITAAIIRIRSAEGRRKAFSTCSAHLVSVTLFYGAVLINYSRPMSLHTPTIDKVNALFYTVVNPLINPIIYSLRNKDVKTAFTRVFGRFSSPK